MQRTLSIAGLALALLCSACATTDTNPPVLPGYVDAPPPAMAISDDSLLIYTVWTWQDTQLANGTRVVPNASDRYTVEFQPGGTVNVRADCNRGKGTYAQSGALLSFGPIALTKMAC